MRTTRNSNESVIYGVTENGTVVTEEVAQRLTAEAEAGYDLSKGIVVRRRGRPARQIMDSGLESRLAANRELLERGGAEREALVIEAIDHQWPRRRIAATLGIGLGTVNRIAAKRSQ